MKGSRRGDFSRFTFDPAKHYTGVLMQQGRVQLDADWNEQVDIVAHRLRTQAMDFIGTTGAPAGSSGFEIVPRASLRFDGKQRYLTLGHQESELYSSTSALTIEMRIKPRNGGSGGAFLCRFDSVESGQPLQYGYVLSVMPDGRLQLNWTDPNRELVSDRPLEFGRWSRVSLSHDGTTCRLSIDGRQAAVLDEGWTRRSLGAFFLVGLAHLEGEGPRGFDGHQSEIRLSGRPQNGEGEELLGWWRFEGGGSDVVLDRSGRGNHAILGGGRAEARPLLELDDVLISAGRYYAGGLLCENERTLGLTEQPDLPAIELPEDRSAGRAYLFYLDVWERYLTPAEEPALREPALGGADTAGRTQLVAQTRWLPVELDALSSGLEAALPEWRRLVRASRGSGRLQARRLEASPGELENRLYRIEVHSSGGRYGWPRATAPEAPPLDVETVLPDVDQVILKQWSDGPEAPRPNDWVEIFSAETDRSAEPGVLAKVAAIDVSERSVTLASRIDPIVGHASVRIRRLASFKWSRDNASIAAPIADLAEGSKVATLAASARSEPGFSPGDWVEILDRQSILEGSTEAPARVVGVDPGDRSITFDRSPRAGRGIDPDLHPVAVRWDGFGPIRDGAWQPLEHGIEVRFVAAGADSRDNAVADRTGDYWAFTTRRATGAIDWPADASGAPIARAPQGVDHHLSPLAVLRFNDWGFELRDTRPVFEPLSTGAVSKAGDKMHGPLEIRPRRLAKTLAAPPAGMEAETGAGPWEGLDDEPEPSLIVSGAVQADTLLGSLGSPGAVETFSLADRAVTRSKISPDVGTVPAGFGILGESPTPPPGYEYTGCSVVIPNPEPSWETRVQFETGEQATELHSASVDGTVLTFANTGRTWSYDPASGRFEERRPMPEPRRRFAAAAAHGKVYVVGGVDHQGDRVGATFEYDPEADEWTYRRPMPTPRSDLAMVEANGNLYALGGLRDLWFLEGVSRRNEVYDPLIDHWTRRRPMRSARYALSAASGGHRGGVFAFGGRRRWFFRWIGQAVSAINEEYLPGVDRWARRPNLLPAPRSEGATARVGDAIFVVGGRSLFGWSSDVSSFEPRADAWEGSVPLDSPAVAPGVTAIDGRLVVHAAGDAPGSLAIQECLIASTFYVHRKSAEPEGDLEPQLRIPAEAKKDLADLEPPILRRPTLAAPGAAATADTQEDD